MLVVPTFMLPKLTAVGFTATLALTGTWTSGRPETLTDAIHCTGSAFAIRTADL